MTEESYVDTRVREFAHHIQCDPELAQELYFKYKVSEALGNEQKASMGRELSTLQIVSNNLDSAAIRFAFQVCTNLDHCCLKIVHLCQNSLYLFGLPWPACSVLKTQSRFRRLQLNEGSVTAHLPISATPVFQRARGALTISGMRAPGEITRLQNLRQEGSYRVIFPRAIGGQIEAVVINTAGGVTGGDKFEISITAEQTAQISVTTQASERIYRAPDTTPGVIQADLRVKDRGQLYWVPQETILFNHSRLQRRLDVDVAPSAKFLMLEPLVFGRQASGEDLRSCFINDRVKITCAGKPLYIDCISIDGDVCALLQRAAIANGARALANIVLVDPAAKRMLGPVRDLLPPTAGASLLADSVLVIRMLAADSFALRQALLPILTLLTNDTVPKNWRL